MSGIDILVQNVNTDLLRSQRDWLVAELNHRAGLNADSIINLVGIINLLDAMLDIADGEPRS